MRDISSSGSEEELENPNFNILNNSLVQIYMSKGDVTDVGVAQGDVKKENNMRRDDVEHTVVVNDPLMSCDNHMIHSETLSHDSRDWPCPHSSNQPPETGKSSTTSEDSPSHRESADSAVT